MYVYSETVQNHNRYYLQQEKQFQEVISRCFISYQLYSNFHLKNEKSKSSKISRNVFRKDLYVLKYIITILY